MNWKTEPRPNITHRQAYYLCRLLFEEQSDFHKALHVMYPELFSIWKLAEYNASTEKVPAKAMESRAALAEMFLEIGLALDPDLIHKIKNTPT